MKTKTKRIIAIMAVGVVLMAILAFCPIKLAIGDNRVEKTIRRVGPQDNSWDKGFTHTGWDGPTGSFSSGDIYVFKSGTLLWRLDIYNGDPDGGF